MIFLYLIYWLPRLICLYNRTVNNVLFWVEIGYHALLGDIHPFESKSINRTLEGNY